MTSKAFSRRPDTGVLELAGPSQVLLGSIVDYAGLFPPAGLEMTEALRRFASHRRHRAGFMQGSFVFPLSRMDEFMEVAPGVLELEGIAKQDFWPLSVILTGVADDAAGALERLELFRSSTPPGVVVSALEVPTLPAHEIASVHAALPSDLKVFFEVPRGIGQRAALEAVAATGTQAKIRTGGLTADAILTVEELAEFLVSSDQLQVPFKATAGLHHAFRGEYPLTYEHDSDVATMHGFVNLVTAAVLLNLRLISEAEVREVLAERDASVFHFTDREFRYRDRAVPIEGLVRARRSVFDSFGSCSFLEPVHDVSELRWI